MSDELIYTEKISLQEWLELVYHPPKDKIFLRHSFPTDKHRDEYISTIQKRTDEEVLRLLHAFLMCSTTIDFFDEINFTSLVDAYKSDRDKYERMISHTYYQRLVNHFIVSKNIYPWEGNTWILDLLPHSPRIALEGLNAYIFAHIPFLPDNALQGLFDAEEVIRAKYIGIPKTQRDKVKLLLDLSTRQFENLTERFYHALGYETWLTKPTRDGGRDIVAKIHSGAKHEFILIECKRSSGSIGIGVVRNLFGVIDYERANRGVIVTSGKFTRDAQMFADDTSIQLISGDEFVLLLNEHLGTNWGQKIARFIAESEKQYLKTKGVQSLS
jgi:restriction system protein